MRAANRSYSHRNRVSGGFGLRTLAHTSGKYSTVGYSGSSVAHLDGLYDIPSPRGCDAFCRASEDWQGYSLLCSSQRADKADGGEPLKVLSLRIAHTYNHRALKLVYVVVSSLVPCGLRVRRATLHSSHPGYSRSRVASALDTSDHKSCESEPLRGTSSRSRRRHRTTSAPARHTADVLGLGASWLLANLFDRCASNRNFRAVEVYTDTAQLARRTKHTGGYDASGPLHSGIDESNTFSQGAWLLAGILRRNRGTFSHHKLYQLEGGMRGLRCAI